MVFTDMATTFECINEDNIVQLDDDNKAFSLLDVRTVNLVKTYGLYFTKFNISTFYMPLVAVRNLGIGSAVCTGVVQTSGGYEITIVGNAAIPVKVYSFGLKPIEQSTYGLQLFNANGDLAFDALSKWIKVVKPFLPNNPHYPPNLPFPDYFYEVLPDASKTYAVVSSSLRRRWEESAFWFDGYWTGSGTCYVDAIKFSGNQAILDVAFTTYWDVNTRDPYDPGDADFYDIGSQVGSSKYLLLDVTGY